MNYSEPLLRQLTDIASFLGAGFLLGALYTVFGFFRRLFGDGRLVTFALDLLFCFSAFGVLFGVSLAKQNGVWRVPSLLAAAGGFWVFQFAIGRFLSSLLAACAAFLKRETARLFLPLQRLSARLWTGAAAVSERRKTARKAKAGARAGKKEKKAKKDCKKSKKTRKNTCKTNADQV